MKNSAWKCSFGGAQIPMQTQLFITILVAKIIKGYFLWEQPALSGWGQVSLILFWCVLVCWYVHFFMSCLPKQRSRKPAACFCLLLDHVVLLWLNFFSNINVCKKKMEIFNLHLSLLLVLPCSISCVGGLRWESSHTACFFEAGCRHAKLMLL